LTLILLEDLLVILNFPPDLDEFLILWGYLSLIGSELESELSMPSFALNFKVFLLILTKREFLICLDYEVESPGLIAYCDTLGFEPWLKYGGESTAKKLLGLCPIGPVDLIVFLRILSELK
jgi:hypothetical protein